MLEKTKRLLHLDDIVVQNHASFVQVSEDDPHLTLTRIHFERATWEEMGMPETITLTIEPGDRLNRSARTQALIDSGKYVPE